MTEHEEIIKLLKEILEETKKSKTENHYHYHYNTGAIQPPYKVTCTDHTGTNPLLTSTTQVHVV